MGFFDSAELSSWNPNTQYLGRTGTYHIRIPFPFREADLLKKS